MVKALSFKGEKKVKKRKRNDDESDALIKNESTALSAAPTNNDDDDDAWTKAESTDDIMGPILIVLPTKPVTCLACDSIGKVFPSEIENMIEGDPGTAEPHDVRQVWIANRVAGTETFTLKGHHGRYLGCDKFGILQATTEAVSPEESFTIVETPESASMFGLKTTRDKFITATTSEAGSVSIRGDAEETGVKTTFRIRMQARFKPRLKASKEEKVREKISRKELQEAVGRMLNDDEVKTLKKARKEGNYHEELLLLKVKNKHDKFA